MMMRMGSVAPKGRRPVFMGSTCMHNTCYVEALLFKGHTHTNMCLDYSNKTCLTLGDLVYISNLSIKNSPFHSYFSSAMINPADLHTSIPFRAEGLMMPPSCDKSLLLNPA